MACAIQGRGRPCFRSPGRFDDLFQFKGLYAQTFLPHGVLDAGVELIAKPFTLEKLATRVREVLDWCDEVAVVPRSVHFHIGPTE